LSGTPRNEDVGTSEGISISVNDGEFTSTLPTFYLTVVNVNDAPTLSGNPDTTLTEGSAYHFAPTTSDEDNGDNLTFSINRQPGWSAFDTATGTLSGTPGSTDVGTFNNIIITVTDAAGANESLTAFAITVNAKPVNSTGNSTSRSSSSGGSMGFYLLLGLVGLFRRKN
jgi:hypothetical protein